MTEPTAGRIFSALCGPGARIIGINPPVCDFAWFDLWALPVGLLSVLGAMRDRGCEVHLVDCVHEAAVGSLSFGRRKVARELIPKPDPYKNIPRQFYRFGIGEGEIRRRLEELPRPDAVFVTSVMTYWYLGVREAIDAVRDVFPGVPVALGGVYATLCPEHAAGLGADVVCRGPFCSPASSAPLDLYDGLRFTAVSSSRGCPLDCDYCASRALNGGYAARPVGETMRDLRDAVALGATDAAFYDDALLWDREGLFYQLCEGIRAELPGLNLHAPNGLHVAMLDERCCEELRATGFRTIRLSFEGTDGVTSAASSGKVSGRDFARAVRNLTRAGYAARDIETYILVGLPGQRTSDVELSIDFVSGLGCRPKLAEFSPIPGSRAFGEATAAHPEIAAEPLLHNNTVYSQYVARDPAPEELQRLKDMARSPRNW